MPTCTFFGHRDCPSGIRDRVIRCLTDLIENRSVDMFYVGDNGSFDRIVCSALRELTQRYPQIRYAIVLERMPGRKGTESQEVDRTTVLPE